MPRLARTGPSVVQPASAARRAGGARRGRHRGRSGASRSTSGGSSSLVVRRVDEVARISAAIAPDRGGSRGPRGAAVAAGRRGPRATTRPGRGDRTTTRSARNTASGIEWVTSTIVVPVRCHSVSSSALNRSRVSASRALNGSSRRSAAGSSASARAIATRWRVPPESVDGLARATSRSPTRPSSSSDRAAWRSRGQPASSIGNRTFSSAVRHGSRRGSWNTRPTRSAPVPRPGGRRSPPSPSPAR